MPRGHARGGAGGRILAVGPLPELAAWGAHELDERFAERVPMPGLVEGHSHLMAGTLWRHTYCGFFDACDPHGRLWPGAKSLDAVVAALVEAAARSAGDEPVVGWGFDPIYFVEQVGGQVGAAAGSGQVGRTGHAGPGGARARAPLG